VTITNAIVLFYFVSGFVYLQVIKKHASVQYFNFIDIRFSFLAFGTILHSLVFEC